MTTSTPEGARTQHAWELTNKLSKLTHASARSLTEADLSAMLRAVEYEYEVLCARVYEMQRDCRKLRTVRGMLRCEAGRRAVESSGSSTREK